MFDDLSVLGFPDGPAEDVILELKYAAGSGGLRQSHGAVIDETDRRSVRPPLFFRESLSF
jgi:hypothetical protein